MIKIVEFFPVEKNEKQTIGTLRIDIVDMGIELLGVVAIKRKKRWHFMMPGKKVMNTKTGKPVRFPFINLKDESKKKEIMGEILKQAPDFIEARINDTQNPLKWLGKSFKKEEQPAKKRKAISDIAWQDPPKRNLENTKFDQKRKFR